MKGFTREPAGHAAAPEPGVPTVSPMESRAPADIAAEPGDGGVNLADLAAFDRRQRRIQHHVLLSFVLGMLFGMFGAAVGEPTASHLAAVFHPYAYLLLSVLLGGTAAGLGWAMLASLLAAVTPAVSGPAVSTFLVAGPGGEAFDWWMYDDLGLMSAIFLAGVGGYAAARTGRPGDVAAGLLCGVLLADVVARTVQDGPPFWPVPALLVAAFVTGTAAVLRRTPVAFLRAFLIAVIPPVVLAIVFSLG
ncbi:hypothetical protein SAMN04489764_2969 [Thermostaphylospora chromogena]|uniref:Uncharacterized protein n=2 Tax=Thermostaphylospora chromogena TaxID=35622 RepID=A0A1H1FGA0_9ACTN|nr:hypothetical protein SAMN04489764_2969 [Thermostaphylospora chromogena]